MRIARRKAKGKDCYYHLCNQICGHPGDYPFSDEDKSYALQLITRLCEYYLIEIIEFCIMNNHFHLVVFAPGKSLSPEEAIEHHNKHQTRNRIICSDSAEVERRGCSISKNLVDISHFMQVFQQSFTIYFNKKYNRRGGLWAGRFFSTILQCSKALRDCINYVIMNPVRAKLCNTPDGYHFSLWGLRHTGKMLSFMNNLSKHLAKAFGWNSRRMSDNSDDSIINSIRQSLSNLMCPQEHPNLALTKNRHWTYGAVIGTKEFVEQHENSTSHSMDAGNLIGGNPLYSLVKVRNQLSLDGV